MKCIVCSADFLSKYEDHFNYFCSGKCVLEYKKSGKSLAIYINEQKESHEVAFREAQWQNIMDNPSKYSSSEIAAAMNGFNAIDQKKEQEDLKKYFEQRRDHFLDPDKSVGDEGLDKEYERLRLQYQECFGKDIKHG